MSETNKRIRRRLTLLSPYLSFSGNCEEALSFYAEALGGVLIHLSRYGDMPADSDNPLSEKAAGQVMHAEMALPDLGIISAADSLTPVVQGGAVAIHAALPNTFDAETAFAALSDGGTVISPLAANPPPDDKGVSGALTDRYGFTWIISALKD